MSIRGRSTKPSTTRLHTFDSYEIRHKAVGTVLRVDPNMSTTVEGRWSHNHRFVVCPGGVVIFYSTVGSDVLDSIDYRSFEQIEEDSARFFVAEGKTDLVITNETEYL